jgi:predicted RNA-binding protein (virulence factor B family)
VKLGDFNDLEISSWSEFGAYLTDGEDEVLLPNKYAPQGARPGHRLRVFVYSDSEDRPVATTDEPFAIVGEVAVLRVIDVGRPGAFVDWGLDKDLLIPFAEQDERLEVGDDAVVLVLLDRRTHRVIGTTRLEEHLTRTPRGFTAGRPVKLLVARLTPMGYAVVVDGDALGFVYEDQATEPLRVGDSRDGWIQRVRPDGRLDVTLRPPARLAAKDDAGRILEELERAGGFLPYHDGSDPEAIEDAFGISKKAFKRAIAGLYRERVITIDDDGIRRVTARGRS